MNPDFQRANVHRGAKYKLATKYILKSPQAQICAITTVAKVEFYENLSPVEIRKIKEQYNKFIQGEDDYWEMKADCKFATLIWLKDTEPIEPVRITKKDWRAWVVLNEKCTFGLTLF